MKENWSLMRFSKKIIVFTMGATIVYAIVSCVVYERPVHDIRGIGAVLFALQMNFRSECNDEA